MEETTAVGNQCGNKGSEWVVRRRRWLRLDATRPTPVDPLSIPTLHDGTVVGERGLSVLGL